MDFEIPEAVANMLLAVIGSESPLGKRLSEHNISRSKIIVSSKLFDSTSLNMLYEFSKTANERALMFQLLALDNILSAPDARKIPSLDVLVPGLVAYLIRDGIDGWLYKRNQDGVLLPWLVSNMRHIQPPDGNDYVIISMVANTLQAADKDASDDYRKRWSGMTNAIVVGANDIANRTIPEMLAERGFYKECREFKEEYEAHAKRFMELQPRFGRQFLANNSMFLLKDKGRIELVPIKEGAVVRCVNDEDILERQFETMTDGEFWRDSGVETGFDRIPLHCYINMFHLELHQNIWVHVQNLEEYKYKPELKDKLILPQDHRELIDILTADMNVLMEDIVPGKSGGTTILCKGAPGLGKTLTAEVYSEVVGKPLYRVHSGQLGITAESVEANLTTILRRAARWDSILLLDEADVYIRCRDNDLQHNAIVAEFLRTLEYFSGLLFMTTNRMNDVDDAILSRCIAIIKYEVPPKEDAMRIWESMAAQFHVNLPEGLVETLTDTYPQASGRDIKELLKLTAKFCKGKNIPFSEDAFRQCAIFRGII